MGWEVESTAKNFPHYFLILGPKTTPCFFDIRLWHQHSLPCLVDTFVWQKGFPCLIHFFYRYNINLSNTSIFIGNCWGSYTSDQASVHNLESLKLDVNATKSSFDKKSFAGTGFSSACNLVLCIRYSGNTCTLRRLRWIVAVSPCKCLPPEEPWLSSVQKPQSSLNVA